MSSSPAQRSGLREGGYICTPPFVKQLPGFKGTYKLVLDALVELAGQDYACAPLRRQIVEVSRVGVSSVIDSLKWLTAGGVIEIIPDRAVPARRRIHLLWRRTRDGIERIPPSTDPQLVLPFRDEEEPILKRTSARQASACARQPDPSARQPSACARPVMRSPVAPLLLTDAGAKDSVDSGRDRKTFPQTPETTFQSRPDPEPEADRPPTVEQLDEARRWAALPPTNPLSKFGRAILAGAGVKLDDPPAPPAPPEAPPVPPAPSSPPAASSAAPGPLAATLDRLAASVGPPPPRPRSVPDEVRALVGAPDAHASNRLAARMARELRDPGPETVAAYASALEYVRVGWLPPEWAVAAWRDATGPEVPGVRRARDLSRFFGAARGESDRRAAGAQGRPPAESLAKDPRPGAAQRTATG